LTARIETPADPIPGDLQQLLQQIVDDVVTQLGCAGCVATTLEPGETLRVRAAAFDAPPNTVADYLAEDQISTDAARVVQLDKDFQYLHATAVNNGTPYLLSDKLHELLRPLTSKRLANKLQKDFHIQQAIIIPFVLRDEVVGSLITAKHSRFSQQEIDILLAFGRQAAVSIQSQRRLQSMEVLERVILNLQAKMTDETDVLQTVVDTVVYELGYIGAMVATLERGNALPVRAYALDALPRLLPSLEARAGLSLVGPKSVVFLDNPQYADNLSVRAVRGRDQTPQKFVTSDKLHDLLRPIVDKRLAALAQRLLGIKQVIAVPFYIEDEVVGNLFVVSRKPQFSMWEVSVLTAFGQQAAAGIRNARLYQEKEQQRQIAQMFGRMAFSATASVHALSNHLGAVYTYLQMLTSLEEYGQEHQTHLLNSSSTMLTRLEQATEMLNHLHEPWRQFEDRPVSVNDCLNVALRKVFPEILQELQSGSMVTEKGIVIETDLEYDLPLIETSADMLTEALRVLIKNAREAVLDTRTNQLIRLSTTQTAVSLIQIIIEDSGIGIHHRDLHRIFDLGWSTKGNQGMGFGLFWTKDYIEGLGGQIDVQSEWGQGTQFIVTMPTRHNAA
jgi:signal transduction histidine kinase